MSTADLFGSDSSGNEFDPADAAAEEEEAVAHNEDGNTGGTGSTGGGGADVMEDSDDGNNNNNTADGDREPGPASEPAMGGTGLSDSEDEGQQQQQPSDADAAKQADADVFGTDSEDDVGTPAGGGGGAEEGGGGGGGGSAAAEGGFDPFEDSDDDGDQGGGGSGAQEGKTLRGGGGRLSKGGSNSSSGKGKGKKRKAGADGSSSSKKKSKAKSHDDGGDASTTKKKKKKKRRKRKEGEEGGEGEGEGEGGGEDGEKKKTKSSKKGKKKKGKASVESSTLQDLGLESSADEAADEQGDADMSDEEVEHQDEDEREDEGVSGEEAVRPGNARTKEDDDFIDNSDDNADLLEEYRGDAPEEGGHSEAEEDNGPDESDLPKKQGAMASVLASMKKRKAQELGTSEREQIAQEFMFKINQAAEDDEESVQNRNPAIYKLKMLPMVKATLAKKELQETFLEFDLLGVLKRWLQPYSNKQLPNLTVRRAILELIRGLPVQIDHLKRSGIGKTVMGLLNCKEETTENKRILRELVSKWNRPVYEKETNYRARRPAHDDLEAMEVRPKGASAVRRRVVSGGGMSQRGGGDGGASRDEAVGNILNARAKGLDPTKSRVPFSNGYAFSKAPRSRVEGGGRAPSQQVDTSARAKMLKKIAGLARPVSKTA